MFTDNERTELIDATMDDLAESLFCQPKGELRGSEYSDVFAAALLIVARFEAMSVTRERVASRRALLDAAEKIEIEPGPLARSAVGGEFIVECAANAFRNGLRDLAERIKIEAPTEATA